MLLVRRRWLATVSYWCACAAGLRLPELRRDPAALASRRRGEVFWTYAERLLAYDNLPRKKVKFVNFAKNSLNLKADHHQGITEKLWLLIEAPKAEPAKAEPPARC